MKEQTKSKMRLITIILLHLLVFCGGTAPQKTPEELCLQANLTLVDRLLECNFIPPSTEVIAVKNNLRQLCAQAVEVRDYDEMLNVCIPWVQDVHCDDLAFMEITQPDECRNQFKR